MSMSLATYYNAKLVPVVLDALKGPLLRAPVKRHFQAETCVAKKPPLSFLQSFWPAFQAPRFARVRVQFISCLSGLRWAHSLVHEPYKIKIAKGEGDGIDDENIDRRLLVARRAGDVGARREEGLWQLMRRRHAGFFDCLSGRERSSTRQMTRRGGKVVDGA